MKEWWVFAHGREMGPVSAEQLMHLARTLGVAGIQVWRKGMADWQPLGEVAELRPHAGVPVDEVAAVPARTPRRSRRKGLAIGALAIALGLALALLVPHGLWRPSPELPNTADLSAVLADPKPGDGSAPAANLSREATANAIVAAAPVFGSLKQKFPDRFDAMVDAYVEAIGKGDTPAQSLEKLRGELSTFVLSRLRQADDDVLVDYVRLLVDELGAFKAKNPTYCYQYASGAGFSPAIFRELPDDIQRRDRDLQDRVLRTAREREPAPRDDIQRILGGVRKQLMDAQANLSVLDLRQVDPDRHGEYCEAAIRFFSEIGKLPDPDKALVMRFILAAK